MNLSLLVPTQKVCLIETESENHMNSWRNIDEAIQQEANGSEMIWLTLMVRFKDLSMHLTRMLMLQI